MSRDAGQEARYRAIAADLTEKIRSGAYAPGQALPGQRELSAAYGVTLMTLRQALGRLSEEGLILRQPGRGTFVAPPQLAYQLDTLRSLVDDLREQGVPVQTQVLARAVRRAPATIAARLGIGPGQAALRLERLRSFAGRPAIHQVSWVRPPHAEQVRDRDFGAVSLYAALAEVGVAVARAEEAIRPALLPDALAEHLAEPVGSPIMISDRTTFALDDRPVVLDRATILGSQMEIRTHRAATRLSLTWNKLP